MSIKGYFDVFKTAFQNFTADNASRLAAALAYYAVFTLAPFLVIIIIIAGVFFGQQAVQNQIIGQVQGIIGHNGAQAVQSLVAGAYKSPSGTLATVVSIVTLIFGASGLFAILENSLNTIWEVKPKPRQGLNAVVSMVKDRAFSFLIALIVAFLLLVAMLATAFLSGYIKLAASFLPFSGVWVQVINFVVSFLIVTALFAVIFKELPDVQIKWSDVWWGAAVTGLLFTIGQFLIGFYIGRTSYTSTYGAVGSLIVLLLWIYYSGLILFFGAEFTEAYSEKVGSPIKPASNAMWVSSAERAQQGFSQKSGPKKDAEPSTSQQNQPQHHKQPQPAGAPTPSASDLAALHNETVQPAHVIMRVRPQRQNPAEKSMTALGVIMLSLVGFITSLFVVNKRGG